MVSQATWGDAMPRNAKVSSSSLHLTASEPTGDISLRVDARVCASLVLGSDNAP